MKKYIAKLVYQIITGKGGHKPQFDEQLRLIEARNEKQALEKARAAGKRGEDSFLNSQKERVCWEFIDVADLFVMQDLSDGAQLYSRIEEADDAAQYIQFTKQKARKVETLSNFVYIF